MNTMATVSARAATSIATRQPRTVYCNITAKKGLLKRFQHFIESTDWEERYLFHRLIDKISLGIIAVSMLYFVPLLWSVVLR